MNTIEIGVSVEWYDGGTLREGVVMRFDDDGQHWVYVQEDGGETIHCLPSTRLTPFIVIDE